MARPPDLSRREALLASAGLVGAAALGEVRRPSITPAPGRLKQAVCRWPYADLALGELCRIAKALGLVAIDLLPPDEWGKARDLGLMCSMGTPTTRRDFIAKGLNDPANHAELIGELETAIPLAVTHGVPNVIAMVGNHNGLTDDDAIDQCAVALRQVAPLAEEQGVTICLEMLNSKVDHKGFQGDHTAFGVAILAQVDSPRVKLLYDIYHMQIMEGDVIRTIRDHWTHMAHFHTAGVPGRHELANTQELNYRGIAGAIADLGFTGFLAHEFLPTRNVAEGLREAIQACTV